MTELTVVINGEQSRIPAPATAETMLRHLGLDPRGVVVELNSRIVRRQGLAQATLTEGDRIEVVHFVGGG